MTLGSSSLFSSRTMLSHQASCLQRGMSEAPDMCKFLSIGLRRRFMTIPSILPHIWRSRHTPWLLCHAPSKKEITLRAAFSLSPAVSVVCCGKRRISKGAKASSHSWSPRDSTDQKRCTQILLSLYKGTRPGRWVTRPHPT